jgi:hypothetical protein
MPDRKKALIAGATGIPKADTAQHEFRDGIC